MDKNLRQLRQKNGEMKEILQKFKTNTQCFINTIIILCLVGLVSFMVAILRRKSIF